MRNPKIEEHTIQRRPSPIGAGPFVFSVFMLLVAMVGATLISARGVPVVSAINLDGLPMQISGFEGREDALSQAVYDELNADKHIYRHYRSDKGEQIDLYIGYYGTAKGGRTGHNPYACLPGAGWGIVTTEKAPIVPEMIQGEKGRHARVNYTLARRGNRYQIMYHWYQSGGDRVLESGLKQNIQRFFGRVLSNRNDGAFVQITVFCEHEGVEAARDLGKRFAAHILALLPRYWPVEVTRS